MYLSEPYCWSWVGGRGFTFVTLLSIPLVPSSSSGLSATIVIVLAYLDLSMLEARLAPKLMLVEFGLILIMLKRHKLASLTSG